LIYADDLIILKDFKHLNRNQTWVKYFFKSISNIYPNT